MRRRSYEDVYIEIYKRGLFVERILIRSIPYFCLIAYNIHPLVTAFNLEISFFQSPLTVISHKCQVASFQFQRNRLCFSRFRETFSKFRKRILSGVLLATKSLENNNTLSFPATLPVLVTSTVNISSSSALKVGLFTF